ncbi:MAG: hypothetical protein HFE78_05000 [Clostridiales bacterium]|nr:hypothetical protein [Clostridiales bacterium]
MDNDNYNDYDYSELDPKKRGPVFRVFKYILLLMAILFGVFLIARIYVNNTTPEEARTLLWTQEAIDVLREEGKENFSVIEHNLSTYNTSEGKRVLRNTMTDDAYFSFSHVQYMPSANQIQLTVRYNESTINHMIERFALPDRPENEIFAFSLKDDKGNRYTEYAYTACAQDFLGQRRYNYRRLLFSNVAIDQAKTLTLTIDYIDPANPALSEEIDSIIIYDAGFEAEAGRVQTDYEEPLAPSETLTPANATRSN